MDYDFTFVVAGATCEDQAAVQGLRDELDALLARAGGVDLVSITWAGESAVVAAVAAASAIHRVVPGIRVCRLDRDLVGVHEIAERVGRTRQNVSQWIAGDRKAKGPAFPLPEGTVGRSAAWLWTEVNDWLRQYGLDDGAHYPTRSEIAEIDCALSNLGSLELLSVGGEAFAARRDAVREELRESRIVGLLNCLASLEDVRGQDGRYVVVVADREEPAHEVMDLVAQFDHHVLLVTNAEQLMAVAVLEPREVGGAGTVVRVPEHATVDEWLRLVHENPKASFVRGNAQPTQGSEAAAIHRVLTIAA